jgi:hypothetical protein
MCLALIDRLWRFFYRVTSELSLCEKLRRKINVQIHTNVGGVLGERGKPFRRKWYATPALALSVVLAVVQWGTSKLKNITPPAATGTGLTLFCDPLLISSSHVMWWSESGRQIKHKRKKKKIIINK